MTAHSKPGNYKAYNIIHKVNYWKSRGVDPSFLFEGLEINYNSLKESDWLDFLTEVSVIWENERKRVQDPRKHEHIGYDVYRNRSMETLEVAAKLCSINYIFKKFVQFAKQYSLVEIYQVFPQKSKAVILYTPKKEFAHHFTFSNPCFIKGFIKAIPKIYEPSNTKGSPRIPDADVKIAMTHVDLDTVLTKDYGYLTRDHLFEILDDIFVFDGQVYAKKVPLAVEDGVYTNQIGVTQVDLPNELSKRGTGFVVLKDLIIGDTIVLKEGEIFDAPYTRFNVAWPKIPFQTRMRYLAGDVRFLLKSSKRKLLEQLEIADQRYFREMEARRKAEEAEELVRRYANRLEELVEERTRDLREAQAKLIEAEKRALEHRITGGFAHEMRNALTGAQLEFKTLLDYKGSGSSFSAVLKKATVRLMERIGEGEMEEIFEPFYTTKLTKGTGLGLSIVKRVVELYGGSIGVRSGRVGGAVFEVRLDRGMRS